MSADSRGVAWGRRELGPVASYLVTQCRVAANCRSAPVVPVNAAEWWGREGSRLHELSPQRSSSQSQKAVSAGDRPKPTGTVFLFSVMVKNQNSSGKATVMPPDHTETVRASAERTGTQRQAFPEAFTEVQQMGNTLNTREP